MTDFVDLMFVLNLECKKIIDNKIDNYITDPLCSKDRSQVYDFIKTSFPELDYTTKTTVDNLKTIIITRKTESGEKLFTSDIISLFIEYANLPITVLDPKYLDYYVSNLDKYYGSVQHFKNFVKMMKVSTLSDMKYTIRTTIKSINSHIESSPEYKKFSSKKMSVRFEILKKNKMYTSDNANSTYLSIDIRSANYNVLKRFCPILAKGSWTEFVSDFTNHEFIIESKKFREIVFGELGNIKIARGSLIFINDVHEIVKEKYPYLKKIFCSDDEIVFKIDDVSGFDLEEFTSIINAIDPNIYRTEMYHLKQLGKQKFFAKEFSDGRVIFKGIPKKFIMQCIKHYEGREIEEIDRKFSDELGYIATYDQSIDFE